MMKMLGQPLMQMDWTGMKVLHPVYLQRAYLIPRSRILSVLFSQKTTTLNDS